MAPSTIFLTAVIVVLLGLLWALGRDNKRFIEEAAKSGRELKASERVLKVAVHRLHGLEATLDTANKRIKDLEEGTSWSAAESLYEDSGPIRFTVSPTGREVFLPPLDRSRVYEITVQGECSYGEHNGLFGKIVGRRVDALYHTDRVGNFLVKHEFLTIGGTAARKLLAREDGAEISGEDRQSHRYRFRIDGEYKHRAVSFCVTSKDLREAPKGSLAMSIECLPSATPSPGARRYKEEEARASAAREQATRERLEAGLAELRLRAHHESHFMDPEFQANFARHESRTILQTLKKKWADEYGSFVRDADLKRFAETGAPEVIAWFEARVKIVQVAERFAVAPPPEPKVEPPKPKRNAAQVRQMKLHREAVQMDDMIALQKQKAEKLCKAKEELGTVELEPEERERIETELIEVILEPAQEKNTANAPTTL